MENGKNWQPSATLEVLNRRAYLYQQIREFMRQRGILEVTTPSLNDAAITDPYIQSLKISGINKDYYLHTSPEFCMKRLLAANSGSIYQITQVFRKEEEGKHHSTEFTMLEWYRVAYDYKQLIHEVCELIQVLNFPAPVLKTYKECFQQALNIDPHIESTDVLMKLCDDHGWQTNTDDQHALLDYLFSQAVIKQMECDDPIIVYDYPACMSALSTIRQDDVPVSERFELFINKMEIANGFNELTNANEQRQRFVVDLEKRREENLPLTPIDEDFLAALESGLPKCSGVAMGLDRLIMVLMNKTNIHEVLTFGKSFNE